MADNLFKQIFEPKTFQEMVGNGRWLATGAAWFVLMTAMWFGGNSIYDWRELLAWMVLYLLLAAVAATIMYTWREVAASVGWMVNSAAWCGLLVMLWVIVGNRALNSVNPIFIVCGMALGTRICTSEPPGELVWLKQLLLKPVWYGVVMAVFWPLVGLGELVGLNAVSRWGLLLLVLSVGGATAVMFNSEGNLGVEGAAFDPSERSSRLVLALFGVLLIPGITVAIFNASNVDTRVAAKQSELLEKLAKTQRVQAPMGPEASTAGANKP